MARIVFLGTIILALLGGSFVYGIISARERNAAFELLASVRRSVKDVIAQVQLASGGEPGNHLQQARQEGDGVTVNATDDDLLVMIAGFFEDTNGIRLMQRGGTVVASWDVSFTELFPDPSYLRKPPAGDWNVDLHGTLLNPDGSVVFNFEYSGLAKLDRCGEVEWTLRHPTHHSVERSEKGGYWVAGRVEDAVLPATELEPFTHVKPRKPFPYMSDLFLHVSEDGEILVEVSVPKVLLDNGLEPVLSANGLPFKPQSTWFDGEFVHLNKIGELSADLADRFPMFEAGDLVLSFRRYNLITVVDPDDWTVKWYKTGPWIRQHDPEFLEDGTIGIFNNNSYWYEHVGGLGNSDPNAPRVSNIITVDPATSETRIAYGMREGQEIYSVIRGKFEPTPTSGFLITEFEAGRILETDPNGEVVWEYINRFDETRVLEVTEGRLYDPDYFTVTDWSCPKP